MSFKTAKLTELIKKGVKIPLFDIDGTLLKGGNKIHDDAFDFALDTVYNQPTASVKEVMVQGKIDTQIIIETLALHGVSELEAKEKMDRATECMLDYFLKHADKGEYIQMAGVENLLSTLQRLELPLGVLTGNVEDIGWEKLKRARIKDYFDFGAFGSLAFKRVDLIEVARKRAEISLGIEIPTSSLIIIGDTPLDIACGRAGNIPVIAVASGNFRSHELSHADLVVESLEEQDKIVEFLNL